MVGQIDRPENYENVTTKLMIKYYHMKNKGHIWLCCREDEIHDNTRTEAELGDYYEVIWDEKRI